MSRGFWAVIGAIVGFFAGGGVGEAIGIAQAHKRALGPGGVAEAAGDLAAIGAVIGIPCGFAIAWFLVSRRQRQS
jgi:hypothetical protein